MHGALCGHPLVSLHALGFLIAIPLFSRSLKPPHLTPPCFSELSAFYWSSRSHNPSFQAFFANTTSLPSCPVARTLQKPSSGAFQSFSNIWTLSSVFLLENNEKTSTLCCLCFFCVFLYPFPLLVCPMQPVKKKKRLDSVSCLKKLLPWF